MDQSIGNKGKYNMYEYPQQQENKRHQVVCWRERDKDKMVGHKG